MSDLVELDGSYGEGGGQILRTALTLSALKGRPLLIHDIRARRDKPGLRPQHLAVVRAIARICGARVVGDELDSRTLRFEPTSLPVPGRYTFDISSMSGTGSAGSTTLLFQALFVALAFADQPSTLDLIGGTHVDHSPPYHYISEVYLPFMWRAGFDVRLDLGTWGWYPRGGGQVTAHIQGVGRDGQGLSPVVVEERGKLVQMWGVSAASNLPHHIIERQKEQALARLRARHLKADIVEVAPPSPGPGTMLFLLAEYEHCLAGFTGYGKLRYPAEKVADDAADGFIAHLSSKAALDQYLADQALLPLAIVPGESRYTTAAITQHLLTNRWVIQHFIEREIVIEGAEGGPGRVSLLS
ncbi:MAG: RNA 3'-terminal phosphate cyclase [Chloroflexi bacterium]|jgi:RNA 3'-terminal phosphate cyclase (ATP)|nr:RNA 3'-terminal phosphate cyclase [Chloroflexota bacterium]